MSRPVNKQSVFVAQDAGWRRMEEEEPGLYREAVAAVSPVECGPGEHAECVRRSNRYRDILERGEDEEEVEVEDRSCDPL